MVFQYLQSVANNLVTWSFSAKYWIVAYKVQLMQAEIKLDTKARLFALLLFGGCATFTLLSTLAFIPYVIAIENA